MEDYIDAKDLPQVIPVFPLDGALLLPHASRPLNIFEPRYLNMLDDAMAAERIIGLIQTSGGLRERPHLAHIGCAGRVTSFTETPDGRYLITLTGIARFRLQDELSTAAPYRQARVDFAPFADDLQPLPEAVSDGRPRLLETLRRYLEHRGLRIDWGALRTRAPPPWSTAWPMALPFTSAELQALLEADTLDDRRETLIALLGNRRLVLR
ncbi:MAG: LON peptidase substrate-binding domain-containing protein [Caulobacteraceae bacterium]